MVATSRCALALSGFLAACGPKYGGSNHGATSGAGVGDTTEEPRSTDTSGGTAGADVPEAVAYEAGFSFSTNGFFALTVKKLHPDGDFCTRLVFVYPGSNNSGEYGVEFPPDPDWASGPPMVEPDGGCLADSEDTVLVLDASGTVWWDDELRFVDVDVTLSLPPDPRWPETDVLRAEAIPVQYHEDCPGPYQGGTGGSGSGGGNGG